MPKMRLTEWEGLDCANVPNRINREVVTLSWVLLHELTHWNAETKRATSNEPSPIIIGDYGWAKGKSLDLPDQPKNGYGAFNAWKLNLREDIDRTDSSLNADSYAAMAMEAYLATKCPDIQFLDPIPDGPSNPPPPFDQWRRP